MFEFLLILNVSLLNEELETYVLKMSGVRCLKIDNKFILPSHFRIHSLQLYLGFCYSIMQCPGEGV